jgi:hypothetical protein
MPVPWFTTPRVSGVTFGVLYQHVNGDRVAGRVRACRRPTQWRTETCAVIYEQMSDTVSQLSERELAEFAALADGTLPAERRAEVEARVAASPELQELLELFEPIYVEG